MESETYRQLVTNHELMLQVMEERRKELKSEVKDLGLQIRQTRMYIERTKERLKHESTQESIPT